MLGVALDDEEDPDATEFEPVALAPPETVEPKGAEEDRELDWGRQT